MKADLFVAAGSRRGEDSFQPALDTLQRLGVDIGSSKLCEKAHEIAALIESSESEVVIVGGGDGTLSLVAPTVIKKNKTLGVLPTGTGNTFARDLGLPTDVFEACTVLSNGKAANVDTGTANGITFLNIATVGLTTLVARELDKGIKRVSAGAAYMLALIRAIQRIRPFEAAITVNGNETRFMTMQIVIGNGRYHAGGFAITEDAGITTGKLHAYALKETRKSAILRLALGLQFGRHTTLENVQTFRFDAAHFETTPSRALTLDGEVRTQAPVAFASHPGALRVIVPNEWQARY